MRFVLDLQSRKVLLDIAQVEVLASILDGAEELCDIDVGNNIGDHGYAKQFIHGVGVFDLGKHMDLKVLSTDKYESLKFVTKQQEKK